MYIHFCLKWKKKGCRQRACFPSQTGLSFIRAVSYWATVRIIIVHHLECWTILWQLIQVWRIRPDISEMKSSLPLQLFLEGKDSGAPSLSSQCETPHAHRQLEQMLVTRPRWAKRINISGLQRRSVRGVWRIHTAERRSSFLCSRLLPPTTALRSHAIAHGEKAARFVRVDVDNLWHRRTNQVFKKSN